MSENAETNMKAGADFSVDNWTHYIFTFDHGKDLQMQSLTNYNQQKWKKFKNVHRQIFAQNTNPKSNIIAGFLTMNYETEPSLKMIFHLGFTESTNKNYMNIIMILLVLKVISTRK